MNFNQKMHKFEYCNSLHTRTFFFSKQGFPDSVRPNSSSSSGKYGGFDSLLDLLINGSVKEVDSILRPTNSIRRGNGICSVRFDEKSGEFVSSNCASHIG